MSGPIDCRYCSRPVINGLCSFCHAKASVPAGAAPETERLRVALKAYAAAFRAVPPVLAAEMKPTERHVAGMRAALGSEPPERGGG